MSLPLDKNTAVIVQRNNAGTAFVERYISGSNLYLQTDSTGSIVGSSTFPTLSSLNVTTLSASYITASNFFDASKGYDSFTSLYRESKVVPNIAALQALTGSFLTGSTFVQGYFSPGDGGGGYYNWIPNDTTTIDSGSSLAALGGANGRWKLKHDGEISVAQFGAVGQDSHQDTYIQNLVDAVKTRTLTHVHTIRFEADTSYTISKSIDFILTDISGSSGILSASQWGELTIKGSGRSVGTRKAPKLFPSFSDGPVFCFQLVKGIVIDGLYFEGKNLITNAYDVNYMPLDSTYVKDANQRTNRYSPQCAISIDGFHSHVTGSDQYPQAHLARYYSGYGNMGGSYADGGEASTGGSARVTIKNCFIYRFVLGIGISCASGPSPRTTAPQNAEEINIEDCHISNCRDAIAYAQPQTRACQVRDCNIEAVGCAINCLDYGLGLGSMPNLYGGDYIYNRTLIKAHSTWGGATVSGVYAEYLYTIGRLGNGSGADIPITFTGCHFDFAMGNLFPPYHLAAVQGIVKFDGCTLQQLNQPTYNPFVIVVSDQFEKVAYVEFNNTLYYSTYLAAHNEYADIPFVTNNPRRLKFNNCYMGGRPVLSNGDTYSSWDRINRTWAPYGTTFTVDNKAYRIGSDLITIQTGGGSSGSLYGLPLSSSIELWAAGGVKSGSFRPNDSLFWGGNAISYTSSYTDYGVGYVDMYYGCVVAIGGTSGSIAPLSSSIGPSGPAGMERTGAIIATFIPYIVSGSLSGSVEEYAAGTVVTRSAVFGGSYVRRIPMVHKPITGDLTAASSLITNITSTTASAGGNDNKTFAVGDRIRGLGLVEGCWVMAISASTYTISVPAALTIPNNKLYDAYVIPIDLDVKNYLSASVNTVLNVNEHYINTATAGITHTLPTGSSVVKGKEYIIKDTSNSASISAITIARSGTDTIDGQAASYKMRTDLGELKFVYNGYGNWIVGGNRIATSSLAITSSYSVLAGNATFVVSGSYASSSLSASHADTASYIAGGIFFNGGNSFGSTAIIGTTDNKSLDIYSNNTQRWTVVSSSGTLEGSGSKIIQTTMGDLTLRSIGGSGSINLTPNGNGNVSITQGNLQFTKWGSGAPRQAIEGGYISTANNSGGTTQNTIMDNVFSRFRGAGARYTISSSGVVGYSDQLFEEPKEGIAATIRTGSTGTIKVLFNPYFGYSPGDNNGYIYPYGDILINYYDDPTPVHDILIEQYRPSASVDIWETADTQTNVSVGGFTTLTLPGNFNYLKGVRLSFTNNGASDLRISSISYLPQRAAETDMVCFPRYTHTDVDVCNGRVNFRDNNWITRTTINPKVSNGAAAVGYMFDTANTMSTAGSKIISIKTAGDERWAVYGTGVLEASGSQTIRSTGTLTIGTSNSASINISPNTTGTVNITSPVVISLGKTMTFATGSNQRAGNVTLVGGTVTVSNTTVTSNTIVILTRKTTGGVIGNITYTLSNGVSFTINSDNASDTSTISYLLIENS